MSSSATVLIRQEALDQIEANPEQFVRELVAALRGPRLGDRPYTEVEAGNFANAAMVLPVAHDSIPRVILSHDGMLNDFSYASVATYARAGRLDLVRQRLHEAQDALQRDAQTVGHIDEGRP
jgi:hypothetical protein